MADDELTHLRQELDLVKQVLGATQRELADTRRQLRQLTEDEAPTNGRYPKAPPTTWYDVENWVVSWMQNLLERRATNTRRWCPRWYDHPEVATRFYLLYESYHEVVGNLDAISYSTWFLEHLDRHLDAIFSEDGPFAGCSPDRHAPHRGLTIARNPNPEAYNWGPRPKPPSGDPLPSRSSAPAIRS